MKIFLLLIMITFECLLFGQEISKNDSIERQEWEKQRREYYSKRCKADSLRAVEDSKIMNKYHINLIAPNGNSFPANKELKEIFLQNDIILGSEYMGSDIGGYNNNYCYYIYMTSFTEKKFGEAFIENLIHQAVYKRIEKEHILLLTNNEHLDWLHEGEFSKSDSLLNKYFQKNFKYPKGYQKALKKDKSFTKVELKMNEENLSIEPERFIHSFENVHNQKFSLYFEKRIIDFMKSHKFAFKNRIDSYNGFKSSIIIYYP